MTCLICEGETEPSVRCPIDPKTTEPTSYGGTVRCRECGTLGANPMPGADEIAGFYDLDAYYTQGESHLADQPIGLRDKVLRKLAHLRDEGAQHRAEDLAPRLPEGGRTLDIGAGGGALVEGFAALGFDAYGVEPDPDAISREPGRGHTVQGTAEALPDTIKAMRFDLVSMTHVLEHCLDPAAALRQARSVTAPGGLFWVEVPNAACAHFDAFGPCSEMFDAPRHLFHFTPDGLRRAVEAAGFEVVSRYHHGFQRHFSKPWRAYEAGVFDAAARQGGMVGGARHGYGASLRLFARTAFADADTKYDCIGLICRAA